ncbi:TonB-dependent receptor [Tenacibaculum finnmarkense]|uniref:TonB-dependent receptor n=1 Tax=Tenacibaculum finnmarkense genomovar finnmarkense TaxID=1458503 RepID=A0AAP1RGV7_9FLAO|nr:TonB-dependent receptor [Tenacibaculum finnmarkense]MBE7653520.1 TonB-dependent receptor [Tenacibaculum finnmarkense genomovar finnmarkense]MBE7695824.1 TonB-dependent receptor [Tenacibaculum finnmarkense genomovar finnmarkense]MCD8427954.1 TonB-dependent receptor [Tenacibaculum finnmarkense genomovar finnmarkense]MCG8731565.1 TonB-dependent receptor [Tenacibaculum finnmarkense]MCG8751474.1 TonB-dependent receptor [Tenacibaculum finnmarkense]
MKKITLLFFAMLCSSLIWAQSKISGTIVDSANQPLPGANIIEKGTANGANSDFNGAFNLTVQNNAVLVVSFSGFETQEIALKGKKNIKIILKEGLELDEVVITGSRTPSRSNTTSALPIDVVSAKDLQSTGQTSFDKALQYKIPSFNTVQTPVNDATSLLDPYEIRNMGPSRTLILINGKRKNLSSLLYTQTSPGRGETGSDISGIPTDAIKTVQVLRDGASAQYGSDAIAGVINIILKDDAKNGSATLRSGVTGQGDGEMLGVSINNGTTIGDDKGFVNYTADISKTALSNRPGTVDAAGEFADFYDPDAQNPITLTDVQNYLKRHPDADNINGSPQLAASKFSINAGYTLSETTDIYANAAYVFKKVNSFANHRTPYWRTLDKKTGYPYLADFYPGSHPTNAGGYDGYTPTFEGDLNDYNATIGFKTKKNDWNIDVSFTTGGNSQTYRVSESHNRNIVHSASTWIDANKNRIVDTGEITEGSELYRANSKKSFDPGGTAFSHKVGNIDVSRILSEKVSVAFGTEFRSEEFEVIAGELGSYDGGGADSFAGNSLENAGKFSRYNLGGYASLDYDVNKDFLLSGTARVENYSDFGSTFVWKLSSRYKFADDKYTLRGSVSTGFRAPTLHQIYTQKAQYSFVPGQGIQVGGLVNNVSSQKGLLGLPDLTAEESTNYTVGIGAKPFRNFSFTLDYYNIKVDDRVILSTEVKPPNTPVFSGLSDVSFFLNAIDTKTSGLDVVIGYKNIEIADGKLGLNLSGNYTIENKRVGAVKNPAFVSASNQSVVNDTQEALFFTSRPQTKWILGTTYDIGKFGISLNNTYFGKTKFAQQGLQDLEGLFTNPADIPAGAVKDGSSDLRTEFIPKVVTDLGINFSATDRITIALNVNNILNVLPEWKFTEATPTGQAILNGAAVSNSPSNLITFNQRYSQMTYDGYHFSQLGTMFNLSVNYQF